MLVSIPDWCDWQVKARTGRWALMEFQFQIGAIGSLTRKLNQHKSTVFQFQIGAIGSVCFATTTRAIIKFQFQIGAIGSRKPQNQKVKCFSVSIPDWCDWQVAGWGNAYAVIEVSIPDWCDWQGLKVAESANSPQFQFQIGAIGSPGGDYTNTSPLPFQFQIGAIGSLVPSNMTLPELLFQFQIGAIGSSPVLIFRLQISVSIPDWCDWQTLPAINYSTCCGFQFQIGAIGSRSTTQKNQLILSILTFAKIVFFS